MIKDEIRGCYDIKGNISFKKIPKKLLSGIEESTSFLDDYSPTISERIYCIMNDIVDVVRCPLTHEKLKYHPNKKSYSQSKKMGYKNREIKNPPNIKGRYVDKRDEILKSYDEGRYKQLSKEECIKKYHSICNTKKSRINIDIAYNNIDFICSLISYTTFLGVGVDKFSERIYCISDGVETLQKDIFGNQLKYINIQEGYSKYSNRENRIDTLISNIEDEISENYTINKFIKDGGITSRMDITCLKCGYRFETFFKNGLWKKIHCAGCYGDPNRSKGECDIIEYLKSIGIENILPNDRKVLDGLELDIYCPDYNIAIEYCGVLWHSFGGTFPNNIDKEPHNKHKHLLKYDKCREKNIRLITIFDNEWNLKGDIIKSMLDHLFNKTETKIYARKCVFSPVDKKDAKLFLDNNHIQGSCNFSNAYGLYHNEELITMMCFGRRNITRGGSKQELIRFCNKINTTVVGGASKILKNSKIDNFISYCDIRYGNGNLYHKLGMILKHRSKPNYFYTKDCVNLLHRSGFQRHKIVDSLDDPRTEREIMYDKGYRRIYDCGNLVFEYDNTK